MTNKSGGIPKDRTYKDLWRAVILQAIKDLNHNKDSIKKSAHLFLSGKTTALKDICDFIGEDYIKVIKWYNKGVNNE